MPEHEEAEQLFKIIKRRIVEIRIKKNLTQEKLAQIMDVEPRTIQRWEGKKEKRLTLWALCRLSIAFDCSMLEFFKMERKVNNIRNQQNPVSQRKKFNN